MSYWQEASCEKAATEIGWHLIYVTGQNFGYPGFRAKSGDLMEVLEDRDLFEGGDFYRVRLRPVGTLTRNNNIWTFSPDATRYSNWDFAFQVTIRHDKKEVCFGPTGQIKVPADRYKGRSLGSYGMSMVIRWARSHYPEYSVARGRLSYVDAREDAARDRRNAFYRNSDSRSSSRTMQKEFRGQYTYFRIPGTQFRGQYTYFGHNSGDSIPISPFAFGWHDVVTGKCHKEKDRGQDASCCCTGTSSSCNPAG